MVSAESIRKDLMVHAKGKGSMGGAQGEHVGTVDHLDGDQFIKLTRKDSDDNKHHWIPLDWVEKVDDKAVYLSKSAEDVRRDWMAERPATIH